MNATAVIAGLFVAATPAWAAQVFEITSAYHHIRVLDQGNLRTLCFDDAWESRMSLQDPLQGHFEYTEYFHMPWLWNTNISSVLMIGLGGASTQRSFEHYYPSVKIGTAEIDPAVLQVARAYFTFRESPRQKVQIEDGRIFLRRSQDRYDLIIVDAYVRSRYGSAIPQHLATKEFFALASNHLTTNGVVAYNVIGSLASWHADIVGAIYNTLKTIFPQVYMFPAAGSQNVVLVATKAPMVSDLYGLRQRAAALVRSGRVTLPNFQIRLEQVRATAPPNIVRCPVLTDDYAPVEGLAAAPGQ
jgi:spermidine synthase